MGEFESGKWIIGILIYFVIFFTLTLSVVNARAIDPSSDQSRVSINDPGFQEFNNAYDNAYCTGVGVGSIVSDIIPCKRLDVEEEETICNEIAGCEWYNATTLFNITVLSAGCFSNVNLTHYNINGSNRRNYCDYLNNESICKTFKCTWTNQTTMFTSDISVSQGTNNLIGIWDTIKFVTTFRAELGLGTFTFLYSFIFFYIPFIMLIWALYMALPVLH